MASSDPVAFQYPPVPRDRRHGPNGYQDYASYRPWLRDEFSFRCVYCLIRERWGRVTGEFDLDHFTPQARQANLGTRYENLLYSCHTCNIRKGQQDVPDPTIAFVENQVRVYPDGTIRGHTADAERIVRVLSLNSRKLVRWRRTWIRILELAEQHDRDHLNSLMGFPEDLPDLAALQPPTNTKPGGVAQSFFAKRERGELPDTYPY